MGLDGRPRNVRVPSRWSTDSQRYHWDSLSEQKVQLEGYLDWLLEHDTQLREVEAELRYVRNSTPGTLVLRRSR